MTITQGRGMRAVAAATLAAVMLAAWLLMVRHALADSHDANDDGRPYVWMQDWKLPGSIPHDVTEGGDMTFTATKYNETNYADYDGVPESLEFPVGVTRASIKLRALEDDDVEHREALEIMLGDLPDETQEGASIGAFITVDRE